MTFFGQILNINQNRIIWKKIKKLKDFFGDFSRIFQEYSRNISQKVVTKVGRCGLCYPIFTFQRILMNMFGAQVYPPCLELET
jgi:hypothetical protein